MIRRVCGAALVVGLCGCSYRGSSTSGWVERPLAQRRVVQVRQDATGPAEASIRALDLSAEPALEVAITAPASVVTRSEVSLTPGRVRRRAEATLVVSNSLNENLLVYGLGWVVLAPVWHPLQYKIRAHGAAAAAADGSAPPGVAMSSVGKNDCVIAILEERVPSGSPVAPQVIETSDAMGPVPLRGVAMTLAIGADTRQLRTDADGMVMIPLRWLITSTDGAGTFALTIASEVADPTPIRLELADARIAGLLPDALAALMAPPVPVPVPAGEQDGVAPAADAATALATEARAACEGATTELRSRAATRLPLLELRLGRALDMPASARAALAAAESALHGSGDLTAARAHAAQAVSLAPWWAEAHLVRAHLERQAGDLDAALTALSLARSLAPEGSSAAIERGALFTAWAAAVPVEVRYWEDAPVRLAYGAAALPLPALFVRDLDSPELCSADGRHLRWRFVSP